MWEQTSLLAEEALCLVRSLFYCFCSLSIERIEHVHLSALHLFAYNTGDQSRVSHMPTSTLPQSHNPWWSESQGLEAFITAQSEEAVYGTNLPMKTAKGWEKKSF